MNNIPETYHEWFDQETERKGNPQKVSEEDCVYYYNEHSKVFLNFLSYTYKIYLSFLGRKDLTHKDLSFLFQLFAPIRDKLMECDMLSEEESRENTKRMLKQAHMASLRIQK